MTRAPADGNTVRGIVRIEVQGEGLENVELLPGDHSSPIYARFTISADKKAAWVDFESRGLPDGAHDFRVEAYDVPAGQSGRAIIAMPPRTWIVNNTGADPGPTQPGSTPAPGQPAPGATLSTQ